uniref:hybrid sensor histidine kinase/response regulator n=1 Tax=Armatimonas sp. TaxID=1872638 RepID=UPI00374D86AB
RLRGRPDTEHEMAFNRLAFAGVIAGYLIFEGGDALALQGVGLYALMGIGLMAHILAWPARNPARRWVAMVCDFGMLSFELHVGGEATSVLFPMYLWIALGNGFRFGVPWLRGATVVGLACFGLVVATTPFWYNQGHLSAGLLIGLLIVPLYAGTLIRKLHHATRRAEDASKAKSLFLASVSHELRTPLNAIIGFSEILHDRTFGELTPKQERYVGNILSSGRHLLQLINDILDLSKIEAGRVQLDYAAFSPLTAVRTVDNLVKALLQKKNITLDIAGGTTLPPLIADQAKFKQVLYNLISNAIKFTPENGKVTVTLATAGNGGLLQVDIKDTGIGIKKEDQDRIFREFEQVDNSYSRQQQGTGLGLALVRKFIEMHGGRIWVSSAGEGQGSTFSFTVPFGPEDSTPGRGSKPERSSAAPSVPKPMALVVDSDAAAAELLTHHLQEGGYDVARASSGKDALVLAQELKPAVITLEVELTGEDGWEILSLLKGDPNLKEIPVVVVSVTKERSRATQLGASEFVVKPIEAGALLGTLADARKSPAATTPTRRGRSERAAA